MGNKFCTCHESEKHGQTSVMCCNNCGLPDEEFWQPPQSSQDELWTIIDSYFRDIHDAKTVGERIALRKELKQSYHLLKKK